MITKICLKCNKEYELDKYYKNKSKKDGYDVYCKECRIQCNIKTKAKQPDYDKKRYLKHKKEINKRSKEYRLQHKLDIKEYNKEYRIQHLDELILYNKEYKKNNVERIRINSNRYQRLRRYDDITYRLKGNMRSSLNSFLKLEKTLSSHEYFCCNQEELWDHLEKQFRDGMTRENYSSVWQVDHIIPLQWFKDNDLMDETNKKIACHYGNLQPLLVKENLEKSDKLINENFKYVT